LANLRKVERKGNGSRARYAWEVRYRDPKRRDRSKTVRTKAESEAFADAVETDMSRGQYLDSRLGKKTLGDWAEEWLHARETEIKPTTFMSYKGFSPGMGYPLLLRARCIMYSSRLSGFAVVRRRVGGSPFTGW
jgi:hypothetical protein